MTVTYLLTHDSKPGKSYFFSACLTVIACSYWILVYLCRKLVDKWLKKV